MSRSSAWQERVVRALSGLPGGPWTLPRDCWIAIWKDGGVLRTFLFFVVCAAGAISELLRFTLLATLGAVGFLSLAVVSWRFLTYEAAQYFADKEWLCQRRLKIDPLPALEN